MLKTDHQIREKYNYKLANVVHTIAQLIAQSNKLMWCRIGLFIFELVVFFWMLYLKESAPLSLFSLLLVLPIIAFVWVVRKQAKIAEELAHLESLKWIYENELNILNEQPNGYNNGDVFDESKHPYVSDLDIFGERSLYAYINRCATNIGNTLLAARFKKPLTKQLIEENQLAIKEVASHIDETFEFRAFLLKHDVSQFNLLKDNLENQYAQELRFTKNKLLRYYTRCLPYLIVLLLVGGIFVNDKFWSVIAITAFVNALISFACSRSINRIYVGFSGTSNVLSKFANAIEWTEKIDWKQQLILNLINRESKASTKIKALAKIIQAFDVRLNILLSGLFNFFLLWDVRCAINLADWQHNESKFIKEALDKMGDFEVLISIATLAHNHPNWSFPVIDSQFAFDAKNIGHPLIAEKTRTYNNYSVAVKPTVDVVTGSNMAGKSTFLRTVGINMVLAYAGAPVLAESMRLSIFNLFSYMRIKDSLQESTSTFKAEIDRLKMILTHVSSDSNSFVLIDEMLRGTNSQDKYLGSKAFIEKLVQINCPALFATHDLQLSELEEFHQNRVRNYHFDIQIDADDMHFDYLLKQGPCKTFNAAILLKQIGLSIN